MLHFLTYDKKGNVDCGQLHHTSRLHNVQAICYDCSEANKLNPKFVLFDKNRHTKIILDKPSSWNDIANANQEEIMKGPICLLKNSALIFHTLNTEIEGIKLNQYFSTVTQHVLAKTMLGAETEEEECDVDGKICWLNELFLKSPTLHHQLISSIDNEETLTSYSTLSGSLKSGSDMSDALPNNKLEEYEKKLQSFITNINNGNYDLKKKWTQIACFLILLIFCCL